MFGQCRVQGATLRGVEALPVDVEVVVSPGLPGLPGGRHARRGHPGVAGAREGGPARQRVRHAQREGGGEPGAGSAAGRRGSGFDLPIAVGLLAATGQVDRLLVEGRLFVGELSLEGAVRPVAGSLAYVLCRPGAGMRARERRRRTTTWRWRGCAQTTLRSLGAPAGGGVRAGAAPARAVRRRRACPISADVAGPRRRQNARCRLRPQAITACS